MEKILVPEEGKFLDFKESKVQVITLEDLGKTIRENDYNGNPMMGIHHYDLITEMSDLAKEYGYDVDIYDLFAANSGERKAPGVSLIPKEEEVLGERAVGAHILRRVFANVRLTDFDDEENTTNLAIAFHQKGIQVGFGSMVKICHNQTMLGADNYAATYSEKGTGKGHGLDIPQIIGKVRGWFGSARSIVEDDRTKMERMKNHKVSVDDLMQYIGMLTAIRVSCDSSYKEIRLNTTYPLNQSQICAYTESLLLRHATGNELTAWDMYDAATDLYKADSMDIPALLPQNRAMVNFISENVVDLAN